MIRSILYQSTANTEFGGQADLDIMDTAWRHNPNMGVTGYLVRTRRQYIQLLEGPYDVLDDLLGLICRDARHTSVQILSDRTVSKRIFSDWNMGYHLITETERDEFNGWLKTGNDFAKSMISYMQMIAQRDRLDHDH